MSRFLVVVPPLTGHVNPAVGLATDLAARGHDVAWVAHEQVIGELLPDSMPVYAAGDRFLGDVASVLIERERLRGAAALKFLWERFMVPLAVDMAPHVGRAIDDFEPDVVIADQQALAGGIMAAQADLPWATSATTPAELVDPLALVPKVAEWIDGSILALQRAVGTPAGQLGTFDPRFSPHLILAYTTELLTGPVTRDNVLFVGPALTGRPARQSFPWHRLDEHETNVLVTVGTVNHDVGGRFLRTAVEAVADQDYGAVVVAPDGLLDGPEPANVIVRPSIPQLALLPHIDAVVSHGGHNTVCETLNEAVPLVVAPIRDDQPIVADQVVRAGAGIRVSFARVAAPELRIAIDEVLTQPRYAEGAVRVADSFASAAGTSGAARLLEHLASTDPDRVGPSGVGRFSVGSLA